MTAPRKPRLNTLERYARNLARFGFGTDEGRVESASPARRQAEDARVSQAKLPSAGGKGPWAATLIVAASDSVHKESADFLCDGTADQVEINDALALLPNHGGRVLLLEGTYSITGSIEIMHDFTTLQGQTPEASGTGNGGTTGTRIVVAATVTTGFAIIWDGFNQQGDVRGTTPGAYTGKSINNYTGFHQTYGFLGVTIRDLGIYGSGYDLTGILSSTVFHHGIFFSSNPVANRIENVAIDAVTGSAIVLRSFDDCEVCGCFISYPWMHGIVMWDENYSIHDCSIQTPGEDAEETSVYGEPFGAGISVSGDWIFVYGNNVSNSFGNGIEAWSSVKYLLIEDNVLERCPDNGSSTPAAANPQNYAGINLHNDVTSGASSIGCSIIGNNVDEGNGTGIRVSYTAASFTVAHHLVITSNSINSNSYHGMVLFGVWDSIIADNVIYDVGSAATNTYDGIHVDGTAGRNSQRNSIRGNRVHGQFSYQSFPLKLRYGLSLEMNTNNNWVVLNDLRGSGVTGSYQDLGTTNDNTSTGNLV